jgi:hypothetical protein
MHTATITRDELPPMAQGLLDTLAIMHSEGHETITRNDLREYLQKKRLTERELTHLDYLALLGFVEVVRPVADNSLHYRLPT